MAAPASRPTVRWRGPVLLRSVNTLVMQRERGREGHGGPEAHDGPRRDELRRGGREPPAKLASAEHGQSGQQHALAAEAVREAARSEEQRREDQVVSVDHPLQLGVGGAELADQGGQHVVDEGRVQVDDERRHQQGDEDKRFGVFSVHSRRVIPTSRDCQPASFDYEPHPGYTVPVRSYAQYCSLARALDVVGERWTLLIVRELLLQGRAASPT